MGKKGGDVICGTPKNLQARFRSKVPYLAFAGSAAGGLLPVGAGQVPLAIANE